MESDRSNTSLSTRKRVGSIWIASSLAMLFHCIGPGLRADTVIHARVGGDEVSMPSRSASSEKSCRPCVDFPHVGEIITIYAGPDRARRDRGGQSFILRRDQRKLYLLCQGSKEYAELAYPLDSKKGVPGTRLRSADDLDRFDFVVPGRMEEGAVQDWKVQTFTAKVADGLTRSEYRLRVSVTGSGAVARTPVLELRKLINELGFLAHGWAHLIPMQDGVPVIWEEALREPESEFVYREEVTGMEERDVPSATYDPPSEYKKVKFDRLCWEFDSR